MSNAKYTGHVGQGGLQGHSIGGLYPYVVYGQETAEGTRYGVMNGTTGTDTGAKYDCAGAYQAAERLKGREHTAEMMRRIFMIYHGVRA